MMSYLNNGYEVMNYFAKFEKFLPHSIIMPSFMAVGGQMPELDWASCFAPSPPPPYKLGNQNTPYKLELIKLKDLQRLWMLGTLDLWLSARKKFKGQRQ